ncbi:hypothetical protein HD597_010106 [Nonomuraea thailandensis]|uniref:Uncharacterized protein n=1 Tax=Nonomuraea thailandensis TaxID=1188745 RepID=A0A9X2KAL5_9ACTN|nr:hypothetical protein [Nonomuraea thailandensis]MCP2363086.1 hypothetical protein [Nonomuraea thailandensis]
MTDRITCPECGGRRGQQVGGLFLACQFCGGQGTVGGNNEPAERGCDDRPPPPPPPAWEHKVWSDPWISQTIGCRYCLGSRKVSHVDEEAGTLVTVPCRCAHAENANEPSPDP